MVYVEPCDNRLVLLRSWPTWPFSTCTYDELREKKYSILPKYNFRDILSTKDQSFRVCISFIEVCWITHTQGINVYWMYNEPVAWTILSIECLDKRDRQTDRRMWKNPLCNHSTDLCNFKVNTKRRRNMEKMCQHRRLRLCFVVTCRLDPLMKQGFQVSLRTDIDGEFLCVL